MSTSIVLVNVKWGKTLFKEIELNLDEPPSVFKTQLWTLTGVAPNRQTVLGLKGGKLKDDGDWSKAAPKAGQTIMLMGTPDEKSLPPAPKSAADVRDDLDATVDDTIMYEAPPTHPPGLDNLGNTCYMNSTVQCLNAVPDLRDALSAFRGRTTSLDPSEKLTAGLRDLVSRLGSKNAASISPYPFLALLREVHPQFRERTQQGMFMQQDAEECYGEILSRMSSSLKSSEASADGGSNEIDRVFGLRMQNVDRCEEEGSDEVVNRSENVRALKCHISSSVNHLSEGIRDGLEETIEKNSDQLGRSAKWTRTSRIDRIPPYLIVQFVRFFWKPEARIKAKILRNVSFPIHLDLYDYCTDDLQKKLDKAREAARAEDDAKVAAQASGDTDAADVSLTDGGAVVATGAGGAEDFEDTGMYELCAVLTHQGRAADAGHYVAWVKDKGTSWFKYDDDKVSVHTEEDVKKLSGGGDWHMAYLLQYRRVRSLE